MNGAVRTSLRHARRLIVFVIGATVMLFGVALLVLPGPAFIVIPLGLAILATEFVWARSLLHRVKRRVLTATGRNRAPKDVPPPYNDAS